MRMRYVLILIPIFLTSFGPTGTAQSQQASASAETTRRVVREIAPVYPDMARRIHLGGTVKVVAVIGADGDVKSVEPVGGSPVLIKAAEDAVAKWKFAPGAESRQTVELYFNP